jgi:hypothetical protein
MDEHIRFDSMRTAAAHVRLIIPECEWIACDKDKLIFYYIIHPIQDKDYWVYHAREPKRHMLGPFGLYTGQTPWDKSLTRVR